MNKNEEKEIGTEEHSADIKNKKNFAEQLFEWAETFSAAMIIIILVFTFVGRHVTVDGYSMEKTLYDGEVLIVSNFFYTPKQNDIVVIHVPGMEIPIIKRVIATEGQTVDFDFENWRVIVDGIELDEPYINYIEGVPMSAVHVYSLYNLPLTVEKDKIFVLGDNRNSSSDSRSSLVQQVPTRNVAGRVLIRVTPFDKFGAVNAAE